MGFVADGNVNNACYSYDGFGRASTISYPSPSGNQNCNSADYDSYAYDVNSNVTSHRLRDGSVFNYSYDALNRATSDGTTAYAYDNIGRVKTAGTVSYTYDALGRRLTETNAVGGTITSAYDAAGDRTKLTWPDGNYVSYVHDPLGRVTQVQENGATSGAGLLAAYTYNSLGQATNAAYAGNAYGLGQGLTYDGVGRLSLVGYGFGDSSKNTYLGLNYTADDRIKVRTQSNGIYDWTSDYNFIQTYTLNGLNQITGTGGSAGLSYEAKGSLHNDGTNTYM